MQVSKNNYDRDLVPGLAVCYDFVITLLCVMALLCVMTLLWPCSVL
jgi:hypothetical protein